MCRSCSSGRSSAWRATPPVPCGAAEKERVALVQAPTWSCLVYRVRCLAQEYGASGPSPYSSAILSCIQTSERRLACLCHPTPARLLGRSLLWCDQCSLACHWIMCCGRRLIRSGAHSIASRAGCARANLSPRDFPQCWLRHGDASVPAGSGGHRLLSVRVLLHVCGGRLKPPSMPRLHPPLCKYKKSS